MDVTIGLISAIQTGDTEAVMTHLDQEPAPHVLNSGLCWAARLGNLTLIRALIDRGADVNGDVWEGFTPVMWTVMFSTNAEILQYLINCGADVNRCSLKRRQGALHAAVIKDEVELVKILLEAGATLDCQDYLWKTPLLHATQRNLSRCVKILLRHNCNVHLSGWVNGTQLSPLLVALLQNNLEITKMLTLAGARFERTSIYQTYTMTQYYRTVEENLNLELRPVYLKQQCRVCIRQLLKPQFLEKLREMVLPKPLEDFLSLEELERIS